MSAMSYLTPPTRVARQKLPKQFIYQKIEGKHHRRIFGKPPYQPFQLQAIKQIKDILNKKAPYMSYSDQLLLRLNYAGNFAVAKVTQKVKQYDEWHQNQAITHLHPSGREILEHGHIYSYGRDYDCSPVIFVRANQIDLKKFTPDDYINATAALMEPLEQYMLVPGVVEKWNIVIDFQGKKSNFSNPDLLAKCVHKIAAAYPFRLKRFIFINYNPQNENIKKQLLQLIEQGSEVQTVVIQSWEQLSKIVATEERQKRYGGSLPNLCEYWPIHTTNKYQESQMIDSDSEYQSVMNDALYFQEEKDPFCHCGNTKCHIY